MTSPAEEEAQTAKATNPRERERGEREKQGKSEYLIMNFRRAYKR